MLSNRRIVLYIVLLIVASLCAYFIVVVVPTRLAERSYEGAKKLGQELSEALQFTPEVKVNQVIVLQQQSPLLELATLSQKFQHQYEWINTWMGSTKKIMVSGTFEAKAGFDLNKKFSVQIDGDKATVLLPAPELLSLEPLADTKFEDENGIWNWVNEVDRSKAINAFTADAKKYATDASFVQDARNIVHEKIEKIMKAHYKVVEIKYHEGTPLEPSKVELQ